MKKLLVILAFFSLSVSASAGVYLDLNYIPYLGAGDAETQYGVGGALGINVHPDFLLKFKTSVSFYEKDTDTDAEVNSEHHIYSLGVEYLFPLKAYRIVIRPSIMVGMSSTRMEYPNPLIIGDRYDKGDMGPSFAFYTGVDFHATQILSPFVEIGYHKSMYKQDFLDYDISGALVNLGVRFAFTGNRDINEGY